MKENIILWLSSLSILLHTPWEFVQASWFRGCRDKPWYIKLRNCAVGIILDTGYTLGVYYLFLYFGENEEWLLNAGIADYAFIFGASLLIAFSFEWLALKTGLWKFHEGIPRLPKILGNIALPPVVQLPLLVCLTFLLTQLIIS
jgi:hypothetical protein